MKHRIITVTEAAKNFADCMNRAHYQNVTLVLLKNAVPFARLVPDGEKVCTGRDLAQALSKINLSDEGAKRNGAATCRPLARCSRGQLTDGHSS